jgi:branched-chain amino acid aminotransferase
LTFARRDGGCTTARTIFEGLKLYRTEDGFQLFRPRDNFRRMNVSAERMAIPQFDVEVALAGLIKLLEVDKEWTPSAPGTTLYIRPFIIATDPFVGVRSGYNYTFAIILSPVGAYYSSGLEPVGIYVEEKYVRPCAAAWALQRRRQLRGVTQGGRSGQEEGYAQVLWLDGIEQKSSRKSAQMNMMFVIDARS